VVCRIPLARRLHVVEGWRRELSRADDLGGDDWEMPRPDKRGLRAILERTAIRGCSPRAAAYPRGRRNCALVLQQDADLRAAALASGVTSASRSQSRSRTLRSCRPAPGRCGPGAYSVARAMSRINRRRRPQQFGRPVGLRGSRLGLGDSRGRCPASRGGDTVVLVDGRPVGHDPVRCIPSSTPAGG